MIIWLCSLIWLVGFWYCQEITIINSVSTTVSPNGTLNFYPWYCFRALGSSYWAVYDIDWNIVSWQWDFPTNNNCMNFTWYLQNIYSNNRNIEYIDVSSIFPVCSTCPEINTWEILSWYILESDIDNLYCEEHWYCPLIDTWLDNTWVEWSALYINEIQHNSAPLINITIPEEFDWDYSWTDEEFDLEVKWYNVDTEYVDWLIRSQNFKPNSDDFSSILTWLVPLFVPWLAIILFLYFVFRFVKKVF